MAMTEERKRTGLELRDLIDRLNKYAKDLDLTEQTAPGEYNVTKDIYTVTELAAVLDSGCAAALDEVDRLREDTVRLTVALNKAKEDCRTIMRECDAALLYYVNQQTMSIKNDDK